MLFPASYLGTGPDRHLLAASHTASLAASFGRIVRNFFGLPEWPFAARLSEEAGSGMGAPGGRRLGRSMMAVMATS